MDKLQTKKMLFITEYTQFLKWLSSIIYTINLVITEVVHDRYWPISKNTVQTIAIYIDRRRGPQLRQKLDLSVLESVSSWPLYMTKRVGPLVDRVIEISASRPARLLISRTKGYLETQA